MLRMPACCRQSRIARPAALSPNRRPAPPSRASHTDPTHYGRVQSLERLAQHAFQPVPMRTTET